LRRRLSLNPAPTALSNAPTIIEAQVDLITETIAKLEGEHALSVEATQTAQATWTQLIVQMNEQTLFPLTSSWWTGGNIPGRTARALTFLGGIDLYEQICREKVRKWEGFDVLTQLPN